MTDTGNSGGEGRFCWTRLLPRPVRSRLEGRRALHGIIANTGWMFFDKVMRMGINFLLIVWITRHLGPDQFGRLSYAIAFVSLFAAVANLGLYGIVVRDIVRYPESREKIIGTTLGLKCVGGCFCLLLAVGLIMAVRPGDSTVQLLVAIIAAGTIFQALDVFDFWFQSQLQSKFVSIANIPGFLVMAGVKVALILGNAPLAAFAWATCFDFVLAGIGLATAYHLTTRRLGKLRFSGTWAKSLLSDSWPAMFAGLMLMVYSRIDQVMIGQMMDDASVGLYAAAAKLAEFWYFFPTLMLNSILPSIVAAKQEGEDVYSRRIQQVLDLMVVVSYLFMVPLALFSRQIMELMYGGGYVAAAPVLSIYVLSGVFVFIGHAREYWVTVENITRFSMYSTAVGAAINVVLNYLLIPRYGSVGAAWATLVSLLMASYLVNAFHGRTRGVFVRQTRALLLLSLWGRLKGRTVAGGA